MARPAAKARVVFAASCPRLRASTTGAKRQPTFDPVQPLRPEPPHATPVELGSEFPEVEEALDRLVASVEAARETLDPMRAQVLLRAVLGMQAHWDEHVARTVWRAHEHLSWKVIGRIAGITKQAAHHRWGRNALAGETEEAVG